MQLYQIGLPKDKQTVLKTLGVRSGGISIMADKMELVLVQIRDLKTPAVNILKQDALSIGAELAVPGGVITCEKEHYDCLLIANRKQIAILSKKELAQPFGLKDVAKALSRLLEGRSFPVRIMGVINANDDSFYAGSRFVAGDAVSRIEEMIEHGVDIVDIGGVSSRPGAEVVSEDAELERIKPICDAIAERNLSQKVLFSIDSYTPSVVEYALNSGFGLVNDITGASDPRIVNLTAKHNAKLCIMHMQGDPQSMQKNPKYDDVTAEVDEFFAERIAECEQAGLSRDDIILDPGIGFGKSLEHNLELLRNIRHFTHHGCEVLVGASRKSMIDMVVPATTEKRLPGTLAIHLRAVENGASIIRVHDVEEHAQAFALWEAM